MQRNWCDECRDEADSGVQLLKCSSCTRRFHLECVGIAAAREAKWSCRHCTSSPALSATDRRAKAGEALAIKARIEAVRKLHAALKLRSSAFYALGHAHFAPFVAPEQLRCMVRDADRAKEAASAALLTIDSSAPHIAGSLRDYQLSGVNWLLQQYALGTGGILGDEMGLGKTFQTLAFISHLKAAGLPGPHLVVTPLAVLQNWVNECRRFTPQLSIVKLHGSQAERDRLMGDTAVRACGYDIYLTTFEMVRTEEAFFTESFLFHTVTIDEGHRLKNPACAMNRSLARIVCPFRLLLTGTPLQNHLGELCALLNYILPGIFTHEAMAAFESAACSVTGYMDRAAIAQTRRVLDSLMIRRVKSQVETALLPKIEFVLRAPLTSLQRHYYRALLLKEDADLVTRGLMTKTQLQHKMHQLQKICNHPKCLVYSIDRERAKASKLAAASAGSEFAQDTRDASVENLLLEKGKRQREAELRALTGDQLIAASGKLQLLDRLLSKLKNAGSRVLLFSQYTLTLDVLEEYARTRWGALGVVFMRLDGSTSRIDRELDMRAFNAAGSTAFLYLISTHAGGLGINLASADAVVLYDSSYNPHVDLQAQDRAHRIGQTKQVHVYRIVAESSFEERVLLRARQKIMLDGLVICSGSDGNAVIDNDGDDVSDLSVQELWSMLSFGAEKIFDPTVDSRPPISIQEFDDIILRAQPCTNLHEELKIGDSSSIDLDEAPDAIAANIQSNAAELLHASSREIIITNIQTYVCPTIGRKWGYDGSGGRAEANCACAYCSQFLEMLQTALMKRNMLKWADMLQQHAKGRKVALSTRKPCRQQFALLIALFDESDNMYMSSGRSMRHLLLDDDFESKITRAALLRDFQVNALAPSLDATALEMFEALVRGSGQQLLSNAAKTPVLEKHGHSRADAGDVIEIDDFDTTDGAVDVQFSDHAPANRVVNVHSDSESSADPDSGSALTSRRPARAAAPTKRYKPAAFESKSSKKRITMHHFDECFLCDEGGDLVTCDICPHVYHLDCVGLLALPKGLWRCPWHSCSECDKSSSKAEGVLFHCMTCPLTLCFECAPDCYTSSNPQWSSCSAQKIVVLQNRGMTCPRSYRFFQCNECVADGRKLPAAPKPKSVPKVLKEAAVPAPPVAAQDPVSKQSSAKAASVLNRQVQEVGLSACVASVQARIQFFEHLIQQSQACRLQLSARLTLNPAMPSAQSNSIGMQMQQLHNGEVFHSHLILQAQQQLRDLMTNTAHAPDAAGVSPCAVVAQVPTAAQQSDASPIVDCDLGQKSAVSEPGSGSDLVAALSLSLENDSIIADAVAIESDIKRENCRALPSQSESKGESVSNSISAADQIAASSPGVSGTAASASGPASQRGVVVPTDREHLSWNEFQAMNKGIRPKILSEIWKTMPWFKRMVPAQSDNDDLQQWNDFQKEFQSGDAKEARRVYNQLHPVLGSFDRAMQAICSAPPACTCLQINVTPQSQTSGDEHRHYEN